MSISDPELRKADRMLQFAWWAIVVTVGLVPILMIFPFVISSDQEFSLFGQVIFPAILVLTLSPVLWFFYRFIQTRRKQLPTIASLLTSDHHQEMELTHRRLSLLGLVALRPRGSLGKGSAWYLKMFSPRDRSPRYGTHPATIHYDTQISARSIAVVERKLFWGELLDQQAVRKHCRQINLLILMLVAIVLLLWSVGWGISQAMTEQVNLAQSRMHWIAVGGISVPSSTPTQPLQVKFTINQLAYQANIEQPLDPNQTEIQLRINPDDPQQAMSKVAWQKQQKLSQDYQNLQFIQLIVMPLMLAFLLAFVWFAHREKQQIVANLRLPKDLMHGQDDQ